MRGKKEKGTLPFFLCCFFGRPADTGTQEKGSVPFMDTGLDTAWTWPAPLRKKKGKKGDASLYFSVASV